MRLYEEKKRGEEEKRVGRIREERIGEERYTKVLRENNIYSNWRREERRRKGKSK